MISLKDDNDDDKTIYMNKVLINELESKWKEIEEQKKNKKQKKINKSYMNTNNNKCDIMLIDSESLHKLIHPIDSSFDDFAAKMLAELESMKPQTQRGNTKELLNKLKNDNSNTRNDNNKKTFLTNDLSSIDVLSENKTVTIDELIIEQKSENSKEKIKNLLSLVKEGNLDSITVDNNNINYQTISVNSELPINEKKSFLIKEEPVINQNSKKTKKKKAADLIGESCPDLYHKENTNNINTNPIKKNRNRESNKILKKIEQNSKLIYSLFPKGVK